MIKVGIVGATGYTGIELLRLLQSHPAIEICYATSESYAGQNLSQVYPHLKNTTNIVLEKLELTKIIAVCDVVFIALPHGHASGIATSLLAAGKKVIDLGADLRLKNSTDYQHWYQHPPAADVLLQTAVYGLPEAGWREAIAKSMLIANPGCYATAAILAATPLLKTNLFDLDQCILDGKSGVSGAGRGLSLNTHFCEVTENFKAYQLAGTHRHTPEIEQGFSAINGQSLLVEFTPHLLPIIRGLFITAYFKLQHEVSEQEIHAIYEKYYAQAHFVHILPAGELVQTKQVRGTNHCNIAIHLNTRTKRLTVTSVIDNLIKGAAGQAIQNMNLMCELPEVMGLNALQGVYP